MQSPVNGFPTAASAEPAFVDLMLFPMARLLRTGDPAATVDRMFGSKHVKDLRLIVATAFAAVLFLLLCLVLFGISELLMQPPSAVNNWQLSFHVILRSAGKFSPILLPALGIFGAVLAWTYQVGSARLGVVDLFACEISTLCRVATITDTARRFAIKFDAGLTTGIGTGSSDMPTYRFTSQESYFPVFESNTRDLQTLEARVVINITAFYTYMKAFRDYLRTLAEITAQSPGNWSDTSVNAVYMLFLSLESARKAIDDLVEFEPENAEGTIVILISELEAYRVLCSRFTDEHDMRYERLKLRETDYRSLVPELCAWVETENREASKGSGGISPWEPAVRILPELKTRYAAISSRQRPDDRQLDDQRMVDSERLRADRAASTDRVLPGSASRTARFF